MWLSHRYFPEMVKLMGYFQFHQDTAPVALHSMTLIPLTHHCQQATPLEY